MVGLVVQSRNDDEGAVGVVTRVGAMRDSDGGEEHRKQRRDDRAAFAELVQHWPYHGSGSLRAVSSIMSPL